MNKKNLSLIITILTLLFLAVDMFLELGIIIETDNNTTTITTTEVTTLTTSSNSTTFPISNSSNTETTGELPEYIPLGYYDSIDGLTGDELKTELNNIIIGHTEFPYTSTATDVWDILREADEDPDNPDNIIGIYTGLSIPKDCQDTTYPPDFCEMEAYEETKTVEWNREHVWSKSRGGFTDEADRGAYTDAHHLVAAERVMNSIKNNRFYEDCHDGDDINVVDRGYSNYTCNTWEFEPRNDVKGDIARMIFYMAVRYDDEELDLEVVNDPDEDRYSYLPVYGDIDDLLRWHNEDPVSIEEIERNQIIYSYQGNRNPFIDMPELVEDVFGTPDDYLLTNIQGTYNHNYCVLKYEEESNLL